VFIREFWFDKRVMFITCMQVFYVLTTILSKYETWTWAAIGGGILLFFFTEYFIHRFALHGFLSKIMPKAYQLHDEHHEDPKNIAFLMTPNVYNVSYHFGLWIAFSVLTQSIHMSSSIMLGFGTYQLFYEWTHFISHRPIVPMTPWGKWMKKFHLLHHYKNAEGYYGVTHPAMDIILGTSDFNFKVNNHKQKNEPMDQ
jgi:4-hydroxysphinganine ceramide fatty acyl 2-hydroxylase